ncbi:MAG: hypothetical protein JNJ96_02250 [Anaerolineales bacterium]|nr:hypothetical protein [Anaerolineales bacterium]
MVAKTCKCNPKDVIPSEHFYAKGRVDVFMVLSLSAYLSVDSRENLDRVRGGKAFADAIKLLAPTNYFAKDRDEEQILDSGHDFQVFRRHLIRDWFFPTFYFQKELADIPDDPQLKMAVERYEVRIRMSRSGFLEIKLTRPTKHDGEKIIEILRDLMELRLANKGNFDDQSTMLKLALFCADKFIENLPPVISVREGEEDITMALRPLGPNPETLPYRQRYATLFLEEIYCRHCSNRRVEADKLRQDYMDILAAIVEGVLVLDDKNVVNFPIIDREAYSNLIDLASWKNDLCIFAPERALIYFPAQKIFIAGRDRTRVVDYKYYWECICRGIEHTIVIRTALQSIAYSTTGILETVPRLTEKVVDGNISKEDTQDILRMARSFSYSFKTLPFIRDILVPSSSFRASYAVRKFEFLNETLHIQEVKDYVERNVDELVSFVQFFSSMELQQELNQSQAAIDRAGFIITVVALLIAAPSFLVDFVQFLASKKSLSDVNIWMALSSLLLMGYWLYRFFRNQIHDLLEQQQKDRLK